MAPALEGSCRHAAKNLVRLPESLHLLQEPCAYSVEISAALRALAVEVDRGL